MARAMPSEEFMERVLTTGRNDPVDELDESAPELDLTGVDEAAAEEGDPDESAELGEEPEEEAEGEPEADEGDQAEDEETPDAQVDDGLVAQEEDEFYLAGRYKSRE